MLTSRRTLSFVVAFFMLFPAATLVQAGIFCVKEPAILQRALTIAESNGFSDEIRLVQGTYLGNFVYSSREPFDLTVKGGFDENCVQQALDPEVTVLDAALGGGVLSLRSRAPGVRISVSHLTFINGRQLTGEGDGDGGGLYVRAEDQSEVEVVGCVFDGNSAVGRGGGAFVRGEGVSVELVSNRFLRNGSNDDGGGFAGRLDLGDVVISNNHFFGNTTASDGGGVSVDSDSGRVDMENNWIQDNFSVDDGGGLYIETPNGSSRVVGNNVAGNIAEDDGGGLYIDASSATSLLANNWWVSNRSGDDGAGVFAIADIGTGRFVFSSNAFAANIADGDGGALNVEVLRGSMQFTNNTVWGNSSNRAAGLRLSLFDDEEQAQGVVSNSLFWQNSTVASQDSGKDIWVDNDADQNLVAAWVTVQASNFDQTPNSGIYSTMPVWIRANNFDEVDPMFAGPESGFLALSAASPMVDAGMLDAPGLSERDLVGMPRVFGRGVDIGALEVISPPIDEALNCFFDWAQVAYADRLSPPTSLTGYHAPFYFRHYSDTASYLGVSDESWHLFFRGPGGVMSDLGSFNDWALAAGCAGS
jgi:hypothetical protein